MLTKSKGAVVASALALAAVGGGSVAVVRAMSSGPETAAPAALPVPAGPAATAALPSGGGNGDGAAAASLPGGNGQTAGGQAGQSGTGQSGTGQSGTGQNGTGQNGTGQNGTGQNGTGQSGTGQAGASAIPAGMKPTSWLAATAGQGAPGPLPAGVLPPDGAVPGALPQLRALAAERQATTALPHSPQLLAAMASQPGTQQDTAPAAAGTTGQPSAGAAAASSASASTVTGSTASTAAGTAASTAAGTAASPAVSPVVSPGVSPGVSTAGAAAAAVPAGTSSGLSPAAAQVPARLGGLDVAGFQHPVTKQYPKGTPVTWSKVKAAGYKYVAIKGTEGDYYVSPWAVTDLAAAKAAGLDVTPYHFAIPNDSGGASQARFALEYSGYATGRQMLPLMLDIEYDPYVNSDHTNICYGLTAKQMTAWIGGFVNQARALTGQYPVIYTTANWWNTCTGKSTKFSADPMWVAAYGFTSPPMPAGWHNWMFWQYTSSGTVPGVATPKGTDIDYFSPLMVGLIDPGGQAARTRARVTVSVGSLGALAGETLRYSVRGLPPGLSVTAKGTITGTVAAAAAQLLPTTYSVRLAATNAAGETEAATFAWNVAPTCARSVKASTCRGD